MGADQELATTNVFPALSGDADFTALGSRFAIRENGKPVETARSVHIVAEDLHDKYPTTGGRCQEMLYLQTRIARQVVDLKDRLRRQRGQGMVEYGLIIALVAIVLVAALTALNGGLQKVFNSITNTLNAN